MKKEQIQAYLPLVVAAFVMGLLARFIEWTGITWMYGFNSSWTASEVLGVGYDIGVISVLLWVYFPVFLFLKKRTKNGEKIVTYFLLVLFTIAHFLIVIYFLRQLALLDYFVYQYPFEEIYFTVTTSGIPIAKSLGIIFMLSLCSIVIYKTSQRCLALQKSRKIFVWMWGIGAAIGMVLLLTMTDDDNRFTINKSSYFYQRSVLYALTPAVHYSELTTAEIAFFQAQSPHKKFISSTFPLQHEQSQHDEFFQLMEEFDTVPNLVFIALEGISANFLHNDYHGMDLMPFLRSLADSSLYWENCFTLAERSFGVLPSSLGGLPYGDDGFTLLKQYPNHHSLINLLSSRGFHASFYTGQDQWFHQNGRFFSNNGAKWIVDKGDFDSSFSKIVVGANHYFWGYNDHDVFQQYFKTMDTLPPQSYFNTIFTGSSHPPYVIPQADKYKNRLKTFQNQENSTFVKAYEKYLISLLFVDDALQLFFTEYQQREEFKNTIFVLTGDHPTSEIPRGNSIQKYHVPLLVYSPKLKKSKQFSQFVSHLDISPTLLNFYRHYLPDLPMTSSALGYSLTDDSPEIARNYAFMDGNRGMYEYYSNGYFLRKKKLYKVEEDWELTSIQDKQKTDSFIGVLENFKKVIYRTSLYNGILNNEDFATGLKKEIVYENSHPESQESKVEFIHFGKPISLEPQENYQMDLTFDIEKGLDKELSIVWAITNENDSLIDWKSDGISQLGRYQFIRNFSSYQETGNTLLTVYLWNPSGKKIRIKRSEVLFMKEKKHSRVREIGNE